MSTKKRGRRLLPRRPRHKMSSTPDTLSGRVPNGQGKAMTDDLDRPVVTALLRVRRSLTPPTL